MRILFACVGNSCRSQMAEAFCHQMAVSASLPVSRRLGRDVECSSAGSKPASRVQPDTIAAMSEVGIDVSGARPKSFKDLPDLGYDYVVTMGCEVDCPFVPGAKVVQWETPDPHGKGIEDYRRVRDLIRRRVRDLLDSLGLFAPGPRDDHQPLG